MSGCDAVTKTRSIFANVHSPQRKAGPRETVKTPTHRTISGKNERITTRLAINPIMIPARPFILLGQSHVPS